MRAWSDGAMVLGKYSEPKRPTNLDNSRARVYCTCSRCGWGLFGSFFSLVYLFSFLFSLFGRRLDMTEILSLRAVKPKITNQQNPVVSGMRTPVYSCCHIYSKVLDKNACRSIKGDLTTHSTILDSVSRRLLLYEICRTAFLLVVSQRKLVTLFSFFSIALSIFFNFTRRSASLHFVNGPCSDHRSG